jgi:hypothetical protein
VPEVSKERAVLLGQRDPVLLLESGDLPLFQRRPENETVRLRAEAFQAPEAGLLELRGDPAKRRGRIVGA